MSSGPHFRSTKLGFLPKPRGAPHHKGARGRRPGPPPRSVTWSKDRSPRATASREGAAGRRTVRRRGIRHDVQAPLRRVSGKPALLWASSCPLFWERMGPKGRPCWLGLPAGCRRQEATSILRGPRNPRCPWWGRRHLASGSSLPHAGCALGKSCQLWAHLCNDRVALPEPGVSPLCPGRPLCPTRFDMTQGLAPNPNQNSSSAPGATDSR